MKWIYRLLIAILLFAFAFYWWASSPQFSETEYASLVELPMGEEDSMDTVLSIMAYNIGYLSGMYNNQATYRPKRIFDDNLAECIRLIDLLDPDIIALQEVDYSSTRSYNVDQARALGEQKYAHLANAINWDENYVPFPYWPFSSQFGAVLSGQSILSKPEILHHSRTKLPRVADMPFWKDAFYLDRLVQHASLRIGADTLQVFNVHLEAYDAKVRLKQYNEVMRLISPYLDLYPVILLGDFNSDPREEGGVAEKLIAHEKLALAELDTSALQYTFPSGDPIKRLDYIAYTHAHIERLDARVLERFGEISDHLPVWMQFRLRYKK